MVASGRYELGSENVWVRATRCTNTATSEHSLQDRDSEPAAPWTMYRIGPRVPSGRAHDPFSRQTVPSSTVTG
jgi:hypothetical protein